MAGDSPFKNQPTWFTPERMLLIFGVINLLNYVDRGTIASNGVNGSVANSTCNPTEACYSGSGIQGDFGLSNFEDGVLSSAFMVGLLIASPIFAHLAKTSNPFRLIGVGLSVWTFATSACGFAVDFWSISIARMLVGVGEASFVSLAAPFVVDNAPPNKKAAWLSLFYMCIPVGMALGYVYGGVVGTFLGWRAAFWIEAVGMLPFAIFCFISHPIKMIDEDLQSETPQSDTFQDDLASKLKLDSRLGMAKESIKGFIQQSKMFLKDINGLFKSRAYTINVLGYTVYNFVLGAYAYWGPRAVYSIFNLENADVIFGGVTVVCGIFGTVTGGIILDKIGSTIPNSFKLLTITTFVGTIFCFVSFMSRTLALFIPLLTLGELFIFGAQGPVNYLSLQSVSITSRPLAMAVSTVCIHMFGDVPSSPLVGALQDCLDNWRLSSLILTSVFFLASFLWLLGYLLPSEDQAQLQGSSNQITQMENLQQAPLLADT